MRAFVFFLPAVQKKWWTRLCDKNFTHCFVITEHEQHSIKYLVKLESLYYSMECNVLFGVAEDYIEAIKEQRQDIRILKGVCKQAKQCSYIEPLNCVSVIKKILGVSNFFVVTPKQLYKHLKQSGYKEIL